MGEVVIVDAVRSPIGKRNGSCGGGLGTGTAVERR